MRKRGKKPGGGKDPAERDITLAVAGPASGPVTTAPVAVPVSEVPVDLLDRQVDPLHLEFLGLYLKTKALCERKDLPPYAARNLRKSLACLYQVVNDGGIVFEHLYDLGV
jgi:hypothetical protein